MIEHTFIPTDSNNIRHLGDILPKCGLIPSNDPLLSQPNTQVEHVLINDD